MTDRPINLLAEDLKGIRERGRTQIRRPGDLLALSRRGERLWVREPFQFAPAVDHLSPTSAIACGAAIVAFASDGFADGGGRRRFAREMPRAVHRYHLLIHACRRDRLQEISNEECKALGFADRDDFAADWDRGHARITISGGKQRWIGNPYVTVLDVEFQERPL